MADKTMLEWTRWKCGTVDIPVQRGGNGQALVFLNGGEAIHRSNGWLESLARDWQVHAPNYPGGGGSEYSPDVRSVSDLALLYLDYIDEIDAEELILVGASFGGWVAAEMAVRCGAGIAAMVLLDPLGIKTTGRTERNITDLHAVLPDSRKATLFHTDEHRNYPYSDLSEDELTEIVRNTTAETFYSWSPYFHNPTLKAWLHRIKSPTLVLWGEDDGLVPEDYGRDYAASIPNAEFRTISGSGHYPHVENPTDTRAAIQEFLRKTL